MKFSLLITSLTGATGVAIADPNLEPRALINKAPLCSYVNISSNNAYAAAIYNKNITAEQINRQFNYYRFGCQGGSNFTAYLLQSDGLTPWFVGNFYNSGAKCSAEAVAGFVSDLQGYNNPGANTKVTCKPYAGETSAGFYNEAGKYFKSLTK